MRIGVTVPNHWGVADVHDVLALGVEAESLGFDSVWTMDHLLNVGRVRERLEDRPYWHPLAVLLALSTMTTRVTLGTSVMVLPYHDPVGLAKYAATLDALSEGRLVLGVGVGALREEFDALGVPFTRRGRLTDQSIDVMKDLWTSPQPSYSGGRFRFRDLHFSPRPVQLPHLPLWIGGSSAAAIARTVRAGDGWHPANLSPQAFAAGVEALRAQAADAGRSMDRITLSLRLDVDTARSPRDEDIAALQGALARYQKAGLQHAVLALTGADLPRLREWMHAIAGALLA